MQNVNLNLIPGSVLPVINVSQYDVGRQFTLTVYEGAVAYSLTGKGVEIRGTKPDGNGFAYDSTDGAVSVSNNVVTITTLEQMTACGGQVMCELRITSSGVVLGTLNFIIDCEPSALSDDTPISDTDIPAIERDMQDQVDAAEESALEAEGYAVGTQDGAPVDPTSPYYENNAKWYSEHMVTPDLDDLANVNITTPTNGQALIYDDVNNEWVNGAGGGGSSTLAGLSDVTLTTPVSDQILKYDGSKWVNGQDALGKLSDVTLTTPSSGEFLKYDGSKWVNGSGGGGGATALGDLTDVSLTTPSMGQALIYDGAEWENASLSIPSDLDDLSDVTIATPTNGDVLQYNGADWENAALSIPADLDDLTDVQLTTPASGQYLKYDGSKWVNATGGGGGASTLDDLTDVDITTPTDGQVLTYDSASQKWVNANGGGFVLADWLTAGGLNPMSYEDLAAVLADEKAVRKLMTIHLAVDYLAGQTAVDESINTILTDNTCAKWINLRDYALDTLYDNELFATVMDASGKYFLGEWAKLSESPETWGPRGCVPIMTANNVPYGTASAYQVFDGNSATTASGTDFSYQFVNPICPKSFECKDTGGNAITGGTLQGSNDGSTWETPQSGKYYLYLRVHFASSTTVATVQFYGRELKVSVPAMTSNTAPYGEASSDRMGTSGEAPWKAFDKVNASWIDAWQFNGTSPAWIVYDFKYPVVVKSFDLTNRVDSINSYAIKNFTVDGFINDSWETIGSFTNPNSTSGGFTHFVLDNNKAYEKYRLSISTIYGANGAIGELNFYGENYSEYDWDADNPRHYLYDHGVELSEFELLTSANGWSWTYTGLTEKTNSQKLPYGLYVAPAGVGGLGGFGTKSAIDLTGYNLFMLVADPTGTADSCLQNTLSTSKTAFNDNAVATLDMSSTNKISCDISSINQSVYFNDRSQNKSYRYGYLWEMWVE